MQETVLSPEAELALANAEQQGAPALAGPAAPQRTSEKQMRAMRRQFVTVMHGSVRMCGHKIDISKQPKNNCSACWYAYFKMTDNLLVTLHEFLVTRGLPAMKAHFGEKLVKQFGRFLDTELYQDAGPSHVSTEDVRNCIAGTCACDERTDAVPEKSEGGTCAETDCNCAGVGSGEVQSDLCAVGDAGQEARHDEQPDATGEATEPSDQGDQHQPAEPGQ